MDDILDIKIGGDQVLQDFISESPKLKMESEKKINLFLKHAVTADKNNQLSADIKIVSASNHNNEELFQERGEYRANEIAGVYFQGIQYFDLKNVYFINNTGIANLIDILKSLLKQGVIIKFVNVREKIKDKFKTMGLDNIFNCA